MNYRALMCVSVAAFLTPACTGDRQTDASQQAASAAIEQLHHNHVQAALDADVEAFLATVTDDFRLMPPNEPPVQGKDAMRTWFNTTFGAFKIAALDFPETEVRIDHDWALRHYTYDWTLEPRAGGNSIRDRGNGLYVYHRGSDGSWKVAYDIWTSSEPVQQ